MIGEELAGYAPASFHQLKDNPLTSRITWLPQIRIDVPSPKVMTPSVLYKLELQGNKKGPLRYQDASIYDEAERYCVFNLFQKLNRTNEWIGEVIFNFQD